MSVGSELSSTPPPALPNAEQVQSYLRFKGWRSLSAGPAGRAWSRDAVRIGVPYENDDFLIEGAINRIARFEERTPKAVRDSIRYLLFDVTHLRASNDHLIADTIPLEAAAKILSSSKRMLQATATTARSERAHIDGNYSTIGNEVVKQAGLRT